MTHAFAARLGIPGQELARESVQGAPIRIVADERGLFWPATADQVQLCDHAALPVVHDDELPALLAAPLPAAPAAAVDERKLPELRARAAELGVEIPSGVRKRDEVLALVQAAEAALTPGPTDDDPTDDAGDDAGQED